ncbi:PAS domain-containing sensor histidine kinase [Methanolobus profundi]|uniref:histidine kinase n=1 Tax=Methanolobus profundi TaxID=487685 RepID=A0A1I4NYD0_9EURY|nr:PAS domain S-box protein [Methanolobus profundi]SFM20317.1 PAS domain S-box-containing protein [Methanolobus profundi]
MNVLEIEKEAKIHSNITLFEGLLNSVPELVFFKDKDGRFIACNVAYADSFKLSIEDIIGKNDYDLHSKEEADHFSSIDKMVMEQRKDIRNEEWTTFANGKRMFLETYKAPLYTKQGNCIGLLGVSRDITLQKEKEEELIRSHEQLISILEAFDQPAYVADPETYELLFANRIIKEQMGNDIIGKKCYEILQDMDSPCPFCTNHLIFGEKLGRTHIWEFRNSKNQRWYRCIDKAIEWPDGRMVRFEIAVDVHNEKLAMEALQEKEEKYRTYVNISPHPIFVIDGSENFVDINPAACNVTGYSEEEILKMTPQDFFVEGNEQLYTLNFEKLTNEGKMSEEMPFRKNDGTVFYLDVQAVRIPNNRYLAICTDITEKKRSEDILLKAKIDAENANRTKSEFLANMSHELRTPLNSVIGFADIILHGVAGDINEKQSAYLENISGSGKHLLNIINDILDISKIESGNMKIFKDNVPVYEIFNEVISTLHHLADKKDIHIEMKSVPEEIYAYADRAKLKQILFNLVGNSIKFTDNTGSITLSTELKDGYIHISVRDTGIGIPPEQQKRLFDPFVQLDSSESRKYEGTGLGLALSKELVRMHGGTIWAESKPGKGSVFTFTVPLFK